ncbi:amidohydrolase [Proteiniborus sp. MB09-C3]|uniref:M20 metallopeptidase family protein n=1 Tax=Proteiniborus sp. MB09-C3 TaxID=3050072 RepID=UPI002555D9C5|nr:amidohydrolase [Proteiniborus sp. MB09-C3]WIV11997.1 amidohydrolase [Proteiniborus sp. MB09-C3]
MDSFNQLWLKIKDQVIDLRRDIHKWPELAFEEYKTQEKIIEVLKKHDVDYEIVAKTGVLATIHGKHPGNTIAIRADIDALSVKEETELHFQSEREGYMHACGHDGHIAIAMGTLLALLENREFNGRVKFIFQPAEEKIGGARHFVEGGHLDDVSCIMALHLWPGLREGTIGIKDGAFMASNDYFEIEIRGKSTHGARPNEGIDSIYIGAKIVDELKTLVSREVDPVKGAVISIGSFNGGNSYNIIPETVHIQGTTRCLDKNLREFLGRRIQEICKGIGNLYGASVDVNYVYQYPVTYNHEKVNNIIAKAGEKVLGNDSVIKFTEPLMISEDFSFFTEKVQGAMFLLGIGNEEKDCIYPLHHSKFKFDEETTLKNGINIMYNSIINF